MAKNADEKIFVNGLWIKAETLKPHAIEECEIDHIIELLRETGEIARSGDKYPTYNAPINEHLYTSNVVNSPLTHMQGLVRYQIKKSEEFACAGVSHTDLATPLDFDRDSLEYEAIAYQNSIKAKFLFHFLEQLVRLSHHPEQINEREIDLFAQNVRGFCLLTQNQLNASTTQADIVFNALVYSVWVRAGRPKNYSAKRFWDHVTSRVKERGGEHTCTIPHREYDYKKGCFVSKHYEAVISLSENKNGATIIKTEIVSRNVPSSLRKSSGKTFSQISNDWKKQRARLNKLHLISG